MRSLLQLAFCVRFFDTVLRAYCTFDTYEASVMIATHVRRPKACTYECNVVMAGMWYTAVGPSPALRSRRERSHSLYACLKSVALCYLSVVVRRARYISS